MCKSVFLAFSGITIDLSIVCFYVPGSISFTIHMFLQWFSAFLDIPSKIHAHVPRLSYIHMVEMGYEAGRSGSYWRNEIDTMCYMNVNHVIGLKFLVHCSRCTLLFGKRNCSCSTTGMYDSKGSLNLHWSQDGYLSTEVDPPVVPRSQPIDEHPEIIVEMQHYDRKRGTSHYYENHHFVNNHGRWILFYPPSRGGPNAT